MNEAKGQLCEAHLVSMCFGLVGGSSEHFFSFDFFEKIRFSIVLIHTLVACGGAW